MNKRVVLQDIADELKLSKNTVSRALRDCKDISEATKIKVKAKANEMGYVPNNLSIILRENTSNLIGIVTCDLVNPYYSRHINTLIKTLHDHGYLPLTIITDSGYFDLNVYKNLINYQVAGIISFQDLSDETYDFIKNTNFPIITYGLKSKFNDIVHVCTDDYAGGRLVGKEFINSNKKNPCYIAWENVETSSRRLKGFKDELKKHNIEVKTYYTGYGDVDFDQIIENNHDFVFAYCDYFGIQIRSYLKKKNYNNYFIYGFDGISLSSITTKSINSVCCSSEDMAQYTCEELINNIKNPSYQMKSKTFEIKLIKFKFNVN